VPRHALGTDTSKRPDRAELTKNAPRDLFLQVTGAFPVVWRVRDSNPRRHSRLVYSGPDKPALTCTLAPSIPNFGAHLGLNASHGGFQNGAICAGEPEPMLAVC
jgi:hypothetical protein